MITCIIIDDQKEAVEVIESHLKSKKELVLKATFQNPIEGLDYLERNSIDLVFIDVQMPQLSGIEFIETLRLRKTNYFPQFIMVTGVANYAIDGFEQGVVDFLLKPVTFKRFNIAIDRFIAAFQITKAKPTVRNDFFFAEIEGKKIRINFDEIVFIESAGNYVNVYKKDSRFIMYSSMTSILEELDPILFMRVQKSYVVSIKCIEAIKGAELFVQQGGESKAIPIGATYKESIVERLKL